jgi:hypothetical protein
MGERYISEIGNLFSRVVQQHLDIDLALALADTAGTAT